MAAPLQGISVLDVGTLTPGKYCTFLLADMGARVLRIERPPSVPGSITDEDLVLNRNKRSITLNLRDDAGKAVLDRLAKDADVLLEGYRPSTARRIGLTYEILKSLNPGLVYCSLSGFGQSGPYSERAAFDLIFLGLSGALRALVGSGGPLIVPGLYLADMVSGLMATIGIVSALVPQQKTGEGRYLDLAMLDSVFSILAVSQGVRRSSEGEEGDAGGAASFGNSPCYDVYETCDDAHIVLGIGREASWKRLCETLDRPDLVEHQWAGEPKRTEVARFLEETFKTARADEWVERLEKLDIEICRLNSPREAFADRQIVAREMVTDTDHPLAGQVHLVSSPFNYGTDKVGSDTRPAPTVGQDTEEILRELDYGDAAIQRMKENGAI